MCSQTTPEASGAHDPSVASSTSPADTRLLYQNPQKWTLDHLRIANVQQESGVSIDQFIGAKYIPSDSESEFQRIAELFQNPSIEDTSPWSESGNIGDHNRPFYLFFNDIRRFKWFRLPLSYDIRLIGVVGSVLNEIHRDESLFVLQTKPTDPNLNVNGLANCSARRILKYSSRLPLTIRALNAGKGVSVDASILKYSEENNTMGIPLATVSVKREDDDLGMARHEIPHLMLQANMAFNYDETLEQYEAFAISIENYTYTIVNGIMSPEYLRSIRSGRPACGHLKVLRSEPYDITDRNTRKEFLKAMMGLGRYFVQRPEYSFPMRKYRIVG